MLFSVGSKNFQSKSQAKEYYKMYFQDIWKKDQVLTDDDKVILKNLLLLREDFSDTYVTNVITDFRIKTNLWKAFEIQYLDSETNTWIPFSIERCIVSRPKSDWNKLMNEYRESIKDQTLQFRNSISSDKMKCQLCPCLQHLEVDHINPSFSQIVKDFHSLEQSIITFRDYHKSKANYRILCRTCNSLEYHKHGPKKSMSAEEYKIKNKEAASKRYHEEIKPKRLLQPSASK